MTTRSASLPALPAGLLGLGTLAALVPARRGSRPALIIAVALRSISGLLAFVSFFADAPAWVMACEGIVIASTVAVLVLMRRRPAVTVPA